MIHLFSVQTFCPGNFQSFRKLEHIDSFRDNKRSRRQPLTQQNFYKSNDGSALYCVSRRSGISGAFEMASSPFYFEMASQFFSRPLAVWKKLSVFWRFDLGREAVLWPAIGSPLSRFE